MSELGKAFKRHVRSSFDGFVHLKNELPLAKDGHRPVNENFRNSSDELLVATLQELGIQYDIISGSLQERADQFAQILAKSPVMSIDEAITKAYSQYSKLVM